MQKDKTSSLARQGLGYFVSLDRRRIMLWCAFLWYVMMAVRYADRDLSLWLHSLGIAAIVGVILALNAAPANGRIRDLGFWPVLRFFLIPFCVASFSAFAKGHAFFLIFPMNLAETLTSGAILALFCVGVWVARKL